MTNKYNRDELFIALKRLGRNEREAGAILDRVYEKGGKFEFDTDAETAKQLAGQFKSNNPLYEVLVFREAWGRADIRVISRCVQPEAPWVNCLVCGVPVKSCERKGPVGADYRCPVHPDGAEVADGWVCSEECYGGYFEKRYGIH